MSFGPGIEKRTSVYKRPLKLFCFPFAGAGSSIFRQWSRFVSPEIMICPIQLPGRETRIGEPAFTEMNPLVDSVVAGLQNYLDGSFAFFGHSMGALIAFEVARRLQKEKLALPRLLIASGAPAPHIVRTLPVTYDLADDELVEALRKYQGTPDEVLKDRELLQIVLPIVRADFQLVETYVYEAAEPLLCPILTIRGSEDEHVPPEADDAWGLVTKARHSKLVLAGNHFFLLDSPAAVATKVAIHIKLNE